MSQIICRRWSRHLTKLILYDLPFLQNFWLFRAWVIAESVKNVLCRHENSNLKLRSQQKARKVKTQMTLRLTGHPAYHTCSSGDWEILSPQKVSGLQGRTPRVIFGLYMHAHTHVGATPLPPYQHAYAHTTYICTYICIHTEIFKPLEYQSISLYRCLQFYIVTNNH